jgi:hypothetical protein
MLLRRKRSNASFNLAQPPRSEKAKLGPLKFLAPPHGHRGNEDGSPLQYRTMDSGRRSVAPINVSSWEKPPLMTAKLKRPMKAIMARAEDLHVPIAGTGIGRRWNRS